MNSFFYNDSEFAIESAGAKWNLSRILADGGRAVIGSGLFPGLSLADAQQQARQLIKTMVPVGVRLIGPDVQHANTIGNLRIVGPDVAHPNFIYWNKDSSSPK